MLYWVTLFFTYDLNYQRHCNTLSNQHEKSVEHLCSKLKEIMHGVRDMQVDVSLLSVTCQCVAEVRCLREVILKDGSINIMK